MWSTPYSGLQDIGYTYNVHTDIQKRPGLWAKGKQTIYKNHILGFRKPQNGFFEIYNFLENEAYFIRL